MTFINSIITPLFNLLIGLTSVSPWLSMVVISFITSIVLLIIFRFTSSQQKVAVIKKRLIAHLLEIYLFRDDPRIILRAQWYVYRDTVKYLGYTLIPLAVMIVPASIFMVQIDLHFGHRPLQAGERAIVTAQIDANKVNVDDVSLSASPGIKVETLSLRLPDEQKVEWRIQAENAGQYELQVQCGGETFTKDIRVGNQQQPVPTTRIEKGIWKQYLHPAESPLPLGAPITAITVQYPTAFLHLFGWQLHWLWPWFALSMLFGLMLRKPLRVNI